MGEYIKRAGAGEVFPICDYVIFGFLRLGVSEEDVVPRHWSVPLCYHHN